MSKPEVKYHYVILRKDGTSYTYDGNVPPYEETWTDVPLFHLLWSWGYTARKIFREVRRKDISDE